MDVINDDFIHNKFGYCYYEIEPGKNPIIFNLYVHPEYRRKGHAKQILEYVIGANVIFDSPYSKQFFDFRG